MASPYDDFQAPSPYAEFQAPRPKTEEPPGALSRFGTGLYQSTVKPLVDLGSGLINDRGNTIKSVGKGLANTALGTEDLGNAYQDIKSGHPAMGLIHGVQSIAEGPAGRMGRAVAEPIAQDVKEGNLAGAGGRTLGSAASLLLGAKGAGAVPEVAEIPRIAGTAARTTGAAIKGAAPDVGMGLAKVGAAAGLEATPIPNVIKYGLGIPGMVSGGKQIVSGLKQGLQAGRAEYNAPQVIPIRGNVAMPPPFTANPRSTLAPGGEFSAIQPPSNSLPVGIPKSGFEPISHTQAEAVPMNTEIVPEHGSLRPISSPEMIQSPVLPNSGLSIVRSPARPPSGPLTPEIQAELDARPIRSKSEATFARQNEELRKLKGGK